MASVTNHRHMMGLRCWPKKQKEREIQDPRYPQQSQKVRLYEGVGWAEAAVADKGCCVLGVDKVEACLHLSLWRITDFLSFYDLGHPHAYVCVCG